MGRSVCRKARVCGDGGDVKSSGSEYGLTRRKDRSGDVGGELTAPGGAGSRSVHSDSNVRKTCAKWSRPVV